MESNLVPSVAALLWDLNTDGVKMILEPVVKAGATSDVSLTDSDGKVIFNGKSEGPEPKYSLTRTFEIRNKTQDATRVLGTLKVVFNQDKIIQELQNHFIIVLLLNSLKTAIVASVLLLLFRRMFTVPISQMSNYFLSHKDLSKLTGDEFKVTRWTASDDEITVMSEQIAIREQKLADWSRSQEAKIASAEQALADADEIIKQEKLRAEASARLAQLGEMATSIAHEINNPLAIISGYNHVISKEVQKETFNRVRLMETTVAVQNTIARITKVITGLRAYARDGSQDPMASATVRSIIDDTVAMTETRLQTKGVKLRLNVNIANEDSLNCRSVQIIQTLVALINNAVDAVSKQADPWVDLGAIVAGGTIKLSVTDAGHGIPPDVEAKIFEPFFTTKQVGEGTGLGLSISFGIIKDHGGKIYVDYSSANTRFVIELKAAEGQAIKAS